MDLLSDLTAAQREAVLHVDGPILVLAGAGSGKTRVITRRVAHLLGQGIPGRNILALTFTNKAATEMRERVAALVPDAGVWIGTFHALCARLLREYGSRIGLDRGFTIYDQADRLRVIKGVMERLDLDAAGIAPEKVESVISRAKNDMVDPEQYAARRGDGADHVSAVVGRVFRAYQKRLIESSAVDFDDLLVHVVTLLRSDRELRARLDARFRYVLVDEYQDTNLAQYGIVRALSVDAPNLCVTGDPDQSIYGWRGANLNNILEFEDDYPNCKVVRLERNYRSTKNILLVADHVIRHNRRRKPKALTTENPEGDPVELTTYATESEEAQAVASTIASLARDGGYAFRDIAVFVRVTALTRGVESALRSLAIPYQVVGGVSFYERQEVKDVLAYLNLLSNPKDDISFLRAVNSPPRGLGKVSLDRLRAYAQDRGLPLLLAARNAESVPNLPPKARSGLRDFVLLMDELAALQDHSAEEVTRRLLSLSGYRHHWESQPKSDGEDRLANLDELVSAARQFDQENPEATILDFLADVALSSAVDRWKDEAGAVTLMTLHAAKGLEFPVVFIVGLEEGLLPHSRASHNEGELEEERRLFFVGITRAQTELRLSHCRVREFRGQRSVTIPSQFLGELPEDGVVYRDLSQSEGDSALSSRRGSRSSAGRMSSPDRPPLPSGGLRLTTASQLGGGSKSTTSSSGDGPTDLSAFRPGVLVLHPQYGLGKLLAIDGAGPNRKGRVAFTVGGERTFVLARSPLRLVKGA